MSIFVVIVHKLLTQLMNTKVYAAVTYQDDNIICIGEHMHQRKFPRIVVVVTVVHGNQVNNHLPDHCEVNRFPLRTADGLDRQLSAIDPNINTGSATVVGKQ